MDIMTPYELSRAIKKLKRKVCCGGIRALTEAERLELTPSQGTIVFQIDGTTGWYGFDGTDWQQLQIV